jgi:hypothetical protein
MYIFSTVIVVVTLLVNSTALIKLSDFTTRLEFLIFARTKKVHNNQANSTT